MRTWKSHIQNILALFICGDFAVLEGKVQQHADEFVARAARVLAERVQAVERFFLQADGEHFIAVLAAFLFGDDQ